LYAKGASRPYREVMTNHHHHHPATDTSAMVELLDLDAEVLHSYLTELTGWLRELAADLPVSRILDLGCGTGSGTFALLPRFEQAEVTAVDVAAPMLERLTAKAHALGVTDRVHTVEADLDAGWPAVGTADLVWASASVHHLADPDRVLREILAALRPGGLFALAEMDSFPRFLPDDVGAGLEARCHALLAPGRIEELPHFGADWGPRLLAAGFGVAGQRTFTIDPTPPPAVTGRYARVTLRRMRSGLEGRLGAADLAALDTLIDSTGPDGVLHRTDLTVRAQRTVWVARRP
jgi:SAM-dependent methyltransferase